MGTTRRKTGEKSAAAAPVSFAAPAKIHDFLERHARTIALVAVLAGTIRIVATYPVFNHTSDEPAHVACGLEWLDKGTYQWEPQHPPLARVATAIGPYLLGARSAHTAKSTYDDLYAEGNRIFYWGHHYLLTLGVARGGILPFFWLACLVVFEWGRRYYDGAVGAVAVAIFTFTPTILAHAGLATTDMALTATLGAAFLAALMWIEKPNARTGVILGLCGGLAILSKFSSLIFFPATAGLALACYLVVERRKLRGPASYARLYLPTLALAAVVCCFLVWAGYRFSFGRVPDTTISAPAPMLYRGIGEVLTHNKNGHIAYLLGQRGTKGWWYFFPVLLVFKTPLAFLILAGVWIYVAARRGLPWRRAWIPAAFAGAILGVGMTSTINIGLRHILPVYLGLSLMGAMAALWMLDRARTGRIPAVALSALMAWFGASSLLSHPDYLPYFNALAGSHPENIAVDSDLDWGQDLNRLSHRLKELGVKQVTLLTPYLADYEKEHGFPHLVEDMDYVTPSPGWTAISVSYLKNSRMGLFDTHH